MIALSAHFTFHELIASDLAVRLGINNVPNEDWIIDNLHTLAHGLERVRAVLDGLPIVVSSGFRSPKLNAAVKGSKSSSHMLGLAADIRAPSFGPPRAVAKAIAARPDVVVFDQMILEGTSASAWVHIAFAGPNAAPRSEILTATFGPGGVTYSKGLA